MLFFLCVLVVCERRQVQKAEEEEMKKAKRRKCKIKKSCKVFYAHNCMWYDYYDGTCGKPRGDKKK